MDSLIPLTRLEYQGDLAPLILEICQAYQIGSPLRHSVIEFGFEDCNVVIETAKGKFVAKIFAKSRTAEHIARWASMMEQVMTHGVNHPALSKTKEGKIVLTLEAFSNTSLALMAFVEGKTFYELDRPPTPLERKSVIEQAALINRIDHHPSPLFDSWAIPNIRVMFEQVTDFMAAEDRTMVEKVIAQYAEIPVDALPHAFVHGDFTKGNILKGDDGKMYILDFSVSNWYPCIQEIAVIAANLLYDKTGGMPLRETCEIVANEYSAFNPLTVEERQWFYPYTLAGIAMEFMGSLREKHLTGNDTPEADYWLKLGREGLKREL